MIQVAVIGSSIADDTLRGQAEEVGRLVAQKGWVLVCGGLGGVMEAAAKGAKSKGGLTVGLLPGADKRQANPHIDLALPTEMGHARNAILARAADALIAVGGGWGTLSEIALAKKMGKKVVGLSSWELSADIEKAATPAEAVAMVDKYLGRVVKR